MTEKVENTFLVDGLLEGRLPGRPGGESDLRGWVKFAAGKGVRLDLSVDGGRFSALADNIPRSTDDLDTDPATVLAELLTDLAESYPPDERSHLCSTLRTIEYQPGREIQTVLALAPTGQVETQSRTAKVETVAPPQPMTTKEWIRHGVVAVAVLVLLVGGLLLIPPVRHWLMSGAEQVMPLDVEKIEVDASAFEKYFQVDKKQRGKGWWMELTLKRSEAYPTDEGAVDAAVKAAGESVRQRLVVEALARGILAYEVLDEKGKLIGLGQLRVRPLGEKEKVTLRVSVPQRPPARRVVLTY